MKRKPEKPPKYIYAIFGETGELPIVWYVTSVSEEPDAIKALNSLNLALKRHFCHTDNYGGREFHKAALDSVTPIDKIAQVEFPGSRYSMIKYKYDEAVRLKRLPPEKEKK